MRLPWAMGLRFLLGKTELDAKALADHIREQARSGEPISVDVLADIADLLDPPVGHKGPTLQLVRSRGGKQPKTRWFVLAVAAAGEIDKGTKPEWVLNNVAKTHGVSERTVRRALEKYYAIIARDIETTH